MVLQSRKLALAVWLWTSLLLCCPLALGAGKTTPTLRELAQKSGYIFAGTVMAVERVHTAPGEVATVLISFRVDQAIRNVQAKQILTVREWAGLWESGERYRIGDRVVLFLYRASKLGLTSTVSGPFGSCFTYVRFSGLSAFIVQRAASFAAGLNHSRFSNPAATLS